MERLRDMAPTRVVVPSSELVDFKEALIFAFLGMLYYENQTNIMASVTGARADSIGGTLHHP
jgi:anhydro-N-acetylmuramic acid kinase